MSILKDLFYKLFPFLFSALRRAFQDRPHEQQMALINGALFAQVIRANYEEGHTALLTASNETLGWSVEGTETVILELARRKAWEIVEPDEFCGFVRAQMLLLPEESSKDDFFSNIAGHVAIIENADIKWRDIAIGLLEFAFRNFVKGKI